MNQPSIHDNQGFTLIEAIVTLLIGSLLLIAAYQMFGSTFALGSAARQYALADNIAYSQLRKYAYVGATVKICDPIAYPIDTQYDLTKNSSAPGVIILSGSLSDTGLEGAVTYTVRGWMPYGCGSNPDDKPPARVEAMVHYGNGKKVTHATYTGSNK